jgi:hypothetical protein
MGMIWGVFKRLGNRRKITLGRHSGGGSEASEPGI